MDNLLWNLAALDCVAASWHLAAGEPYAARLVLARAGLMLRSRRSKAVALTRSAKSGWEPI